METYATKRNGVLVRDPATETTRMDYVARLPEGTMVKEVVTRFYGHHTDAQTRTMWGLVIGWAMREINEHGIDLAQLLGSQVIPDGVIPSKDQVMMLLYAMAGDVGEDGERKTLSQMDTAEASRFFEKCRDALARLPRPIFIPDPNPLWKEMQEKT